MSRTLQDISRSISLNNLVQAKPSGQIATLLILIMVIVLVFILVTVNLGVTSIQSTRLSNAADAASLYLASQLATRSTMLYRNIGGGHCETGWSGLGALLAPALDLGSFGLFSYAAGVYDSPVQGMINGLETAVKIVGGALAGAQVGGFYGAIIGAVIATAGVVYSNVVGEQMIRDAMKEIGRQLNGLPDYDRIRESVFFQAFSQTIDDPSTTPDVNDSNGNGDFEEKVPYFQVWERNRIEKLKTLVPELKNLTQGFVDGPLADFRKAAEGSYGVNCVTMSDGEDNWDICSPGMMHREETGIDDDGQVVVTNAGGVLVELASAVEKLGLPKYDISFWKPGVPPPPLFLGSQKYLNEMDAVADKLKQFVWLAQVLEGADPDRRVATFQDWLKTLYDPDSAEDYYHLLSKIADKLKDWKIEIEEKRKMLPQCAYDDDSVDNPPCQDGDFGTISSAGTVDEFKQATSQIDSLINAIENFRTASQTFFVKAQDVYAAMQKIGGINPATYSWIDSGGGHSIQIKALPIPFKVPATRVTSDSKLFTTTTCISIDPTTVSDICIIEITRKDPANKNMGMLGQWNPFSGTIHKVSRAYYNINRVELKQ